MKKIIMLLLFLPLLLLAVPGANAQTLKVTSFPSGASITVDGKAVVNTTPASIPIAIGTHTVVVALNDAGWLPSTQTVKITKVGPYSLAVTLLPVLTIGPQGPAGAAGPQGPTGATGSQGPAGAAGAQGPQGPAGPAGTNGINGTGFNFRNAFNPSSTYAVNDVVIYNGSTYVAIAADGPDTNTPDVNASVWTVIAAQGAAGSQGPQGLAGAIGPQGPAGTNGANGVNGAPGPQGPTGPQGPQGLQGPQGVPGTNGTNGAGINWRGTWNSTTSYNVNDAVSYNGTSYAAAASNTNQEPDLTATGNTNFSLSLGSISFSIPSNSTFTPFTNNGTGFSVSNMTGSWVNPYNGYAFGPVSTSLTFWQSGGPACPTGTEVFSATLASQNPYPSIVVVCGSSPLFTGSLSSPVFLAGNYSLKAMGAWPYYDGSWLSSNVTVVPPPAVWNVMAQAGASGAAGAAGPQGPQGPQGAIGPQGPQGPSGATGAQGSAGPAGAPGPQGPTGPTGPAGTNAPNAVISLPSEGITCPTTQNVSGGCGQTLLQGQNATVSSITLPAAGSYFILATTVLEDNYTGGSITVSCQLSDSNGQILNYGPYAPSAAAVVSMPPAISQGSGNPPLLSLQPITIQTVLTTTGGDTVSLQCSGDAFITASVPTLTAIQVTPSH